jgi:hypothetical protein
MAGVIRCPYCVEANAFKPMLARAAGWFLCPCCGHVSIPDQPLYACTCKNCLKRQPAKIHYQPGKF